MGNKKKCWKILEIIWVNMVVIYYTKEVEKQLSCFFLSRDSMQNKPATSGLFRKCLFNQIILIFLATLKLFFPLFSFPLEYFLISLQFSCLDHYSFLLPGLTPLNILLENISTSHFESLRWLNSTLHDFQGSHLNSGGIT